MLLYPLLWLNLLLGLPALGYTVYLLYTGVPVMMELFVPKGAGSCLRRGAGRGIVVMLVGVL